jgi:hypothetical protein
MVKDGTKGRGRDTGKEGIKGFSSQRYGGKDVYWEQRRERFPINLPVLHYLLLT